MCSSNPAGSFPLIFKPTFFRVSPSFRVSVFINENFFTRFFILRHHRLKESIFAEANAGSGHQSDVIEENIWKTIGTSVLTDSLRM